ncbi:MAG: DMT family transporter [Candidatus Brocadiales bacterium]|nr:DMT family transporter [Candidatus Brocadiales bacterium]
MIGITFALVAAASWGTGDFLGGLASRKLNQFTVLLVTASSSLMLLFVCMVIWRESLPAVDNLIMAVIAGISGALGLAALYKGLSLGNAALVALVTGVIGAIIPTLVGLMLEGFPGSMKLIGFGLAFVGIWLVTRAKDGNGHQIRDGLGLALLAGIGFGGFLAIIAQVEGDQIFAPLVFAKLASIVLAIGLMKSRQLSTPKLTEVPIAIWSGVFDAGGNIFYLFATQYTRLDIAALLSSLYPVATVLLSNVILKEKLSAQQWIGVSTCVAAIMLITSG